MHFLGSPEGDLALAQAVVYLALAPKSNAVYTAYSEVQADIQKTVAEPVPLHLRNAPTRLMKELDYGKGYEYAHDVAGARRGYGVSAAVFGGAELLQADGRGPGTATGAENG